MVEVNVLVKVSVMVDVKTGVFVWVLVGMGVGMETGMTAMFLEHPMIIQEERMTDCRTRVVVLTGLIDAPYVTGLIGSLTVRTKQPALDRS